MVVAIDGPAGTGKSTVSRMVAEKTDFFYLNSGRFYRARETRRMARGATRGTLPVRAHRTRRPETPKPR